MTLNKSLGTHVPLCPAASLTCKLETNTSGLVAGILILWFPRQELTSPFP